MILYYHEDCKEEFEIVSQMLSWKKIDFKIKQMPENLPKNKPILVNQNGQIMGEGLIGVVKHLDSRGLFDART